jgi:hypothetical protein
VFRYCSIAAPSFKTFMIPFRQKKNPRGRIQGGCEWMIEED